MDVLLSLVLTLTLVLIITMAWSINVYQRMRTSALPEDKFESSCRVSSLTVAAGFYMSVLVMIVAILVLCFFIVFLRNKNKYDYKGR